MQLNLPTPLERLSILANLNLWIKRDDLIHPVVAGNKWRKLKGYVEQLEPASHVVSFGGAYSNHLAAAASVLQAYGHTGSFIIRGEELTPNSSPVLQHCQQQGMQLMFISRSEFRQLRQQQWQLTPQQFQHWQLPPDSQRLPEGGSGPHNLAGCAELWQELSQAGPIDQLWLAAGTGGTARGLLRAMPKNCQTSLHIISAVKGAKREQQQTEALAAAKNITCHWQDETTFGGFAKHTAALQQASNAFTQATGIPLDTVYNAKLYWHLQEYACTSAPNNDKIVWLHTGGFGLHSTT